MKKLARHKITFEDSQDESSLLLGQIGIGNREIMRRSGLTNCQITYRLAKAKRLLGRDHGFRVDWRNGNHPLLERIMKDYASIMVREIQTKLVPKIVHPTPKVVKVKVVE